MSHGQFASGHALPSNKISHREGRHCSKESPLAFWFAGLADLTSESVALYPLPAGGLGLAKWMKPGQ
jgi:hypothetical protein